MALPNQVHQAPFPSLSIIVLTMNNNPAILSAVLDLDIEGIVLKQGAPTDLPKALAALQKGKKFTRKRFSPVGKSVLVVTVTSVSRQKRVKFCACLRKASGDRDR